MSNCCLTPNEYNFSAISWREQVTFWWGDNDNDDDDVRFAQDQHAELNFDSANSLKQ